MGFKEIKKNEIIQEKEKMFLEQARGETNEPKKQKTVSVLISLETIERLKRYQKTEAKKIETQSYIYETAVNEWLDKKGFE